jgi:hypothetical protein
MAAVGRPRVFHPFGGRTQGEQHRQQRLLWNTRSASQRLSVEVRRYLAQPLERDQMNRRRPMT